ncbi:MAG: hypothetical protein GZ088_09655 [Acidipila sp.]|nr:hypothetical protein [Acidipila sp.]
MPSPEDVIADPRFQAVITGISARVGQSMAQMLQAHLQEVAKTMGPAGRIVEVIRRDVDNRPIPQQTSSPQLLAELNDNMTDLIAELQHMNDLVEQQSDAVAPAPRRRKRKR